MDDPVTPIDEMVGAMDTIVRSGRARYIGVSNFLAYRLAKALGRHDTLKLTRFVSAQPRYNLLFREVERELFPLAQEEGLAVISFNPLAGGLLSGKYEAPLFAGGSKTNSQPPTPGPKIAVGDVPKLNFVPVWDCAKRITFRSVDSNSAMQSL